MLRRTIFSLSGLILILLMPFVTQAKIELSGAVRNDVILLDDGNRTQLNNILENKLVLQRKADEWKFYSDLRFYMYSGETIELPEELPMQFDCFTLRILRLFIRWYTDYGDFSIGKTYVNFGNLSVFNPFAIDPNVNVLDLSYSKDGILALTYDVSLGDLSGGRIYISPEAQETEMAAGMTIFTNLSNFDFGFVANRSGRDNNIAGIYFKGDLELGIQGSYAFHFDDRAVNTFSEITAGGDYSFFAGKWLLGALFYLNENGSGEAWNYDLTDFIQSTYPAFPAKYYVYAYMAYIPDEFFQSQLNAFINANDSSSLLVPTVTWLLADGLSISLQGVFATGGGDTQYSRKVLGNYVILVRVEAKL